MLHLLALVAGIAVGLLVYNVMFEKESREMRLIGSVVGALVAAWLAQSLMGTKKITTSGPPGMPSVMTPMGPPIAQIQNQTVFELQYRLVPIPEGEAKFIVSLDSFRGYGGGSTTESLSSVIAGQSGVVLASTSKTLPYTVVLLYTLPATLGDDAGAILILDPSGNMVKTITGNLQVGNPSPGVFSVTPFAGAVVGTRTS